MKNKDYSIIDNRITIVIALYHRYIETSYYFRDIFQYMYRYYFGSVLLLVRKSGLPRLRYKGRIRIKQNLRGSLTPGHPSR